MKLHNIRSESKGYTTWGCMWKKGELSLVDGKPAKSFFCKNKKGEAVLMQSRVTSFWQDGSVKWTAHTADAALLGEQIEVRLADECEQEGDYGIRIQETEQKLTIYAGELELYITKNTNNLVDAVKIKGNTVLTDAKLVLELEEPMLIEGNKAKVNREYLGQIEHITIEEKGPLQAILKYEGSHISATGERKMPFIIRMVIGMDCSDIKLTHTFLYDGDEEKDYLKGLGIRFQTPIKGELYNRHVKITNDYGCFHEGLVPLISWRPRVPQGLYERQIQGEKLILEGNDKEIVDQVLEDTPYWSEYSLCQDSVSHFVIRKKLAEENCCYIDSLHGYRTHGGFAFGSEGGSILLGIRDFWEKYPSGYDVKGLDLDEAEATIWFWSPKAESMDFRHYANRGYNQVCYEGYDYKGATPYGIACTNECMIRFDEKIIPTDRELDAFCNQVNKPALFVAEPEFYHKMRAFGYWSVPKKDTPMEIWLEEQLERAADFYLNEVEQRGWYGMFNYGDFMHTYDHQRHQWRYDIGGYAWDNTELVPTLWLWLYFMRTGREDIFTLAEKLSRHAAEVDVYHFGKYKGLGSRHNVRHWGCPCKEARIAMAAHHRFLYYLTGDRRFEDIFDELKDNEMSFLNKDPLGDFYEKEEMVYPSHARSGPDWSSLCSNWMTEWERKNDIRYRDKILVGMNDIKKAPLQLTSGPDFEFEPQTCHLRYIGERTTGGTHLQICMGAPQVWMELADLLEDEEFKKMIADYGRFYYLPKEKQLEESQGIIGDREFTLPFMSAAMGAYGAWYLKDEWLAKRTWQILLETMIHDGNHEGFATKKIPNCGNQKELVEIAWISTNFAAQWCLNVIMVLEFIRDALPSTMEEAEVLTDGADAFYFRKA
ncbi:MAG: hypothetical protein E7290_04140 [Lachnospiraceae bacterium]|nr:hypothetical protein [Lachnospiraceae bacterium]